MPHSGALFLHATAAAVMAYGFHSVKSLPLNDLIETQKGGHWQFLTIQGLAAAWLAMTISLACDLLPSVTALRAAKRVSLMIALPLAIVVSAVYWSLILFFPALILRSEAAAPEPSSPPATPVLMWIPLEVDLSLHVVPAITLLADFVFFEKKYSEKYVRFGAPLAVLVCGTSYACWVEYCATYNGTFPYPFLTENPLEVRIGIYAFVSFIAWRCFCFVNAIHP